MGWVLPRCILGKPKADPMSGRPLTMKLPMDIYFGDGVLVVAKIWLLLSA